MKDQRKTKAQLIEELEALRQSEERYRQLFESANDAIISLTLDGIITTTNRGAEVLLGWSREERVGRHYSEFLTPASVTFTAERARRIQAGEKVPSIYEIEVVRKDGSVVPVEARSRFIHDREERPVGILVAHRDITARKRAEATIIEWKNRYEAAIQASGQVLYDWDPFTNKMIWGVNVEQLFGYCPEEMPGDLVGTIELIHPNDREAFQQEIDRVIATKESFRLEYRIRRKNGECATVEDRGYFFRDSAGNLVRMVGFLVDITERKRAGEALREGEEKFRAQYRGIPIPTYTWRRLGEEFVLIDYNDAATAITGGRIIDFLGKSAREMYQDQPEILEEFTRCFVGKSTIKDEIFYQLKTTGESKHFAVNYVFVPPDLVMIHTEDITERKQAEEALRRQKDLYETLLKAQSDLGEGMLITDSQRILYANDAACQISGYSAAELAALSSFLELVIPEERAVLDERLRQRLSGQSVLDHYKTTILHKHGQQVDLEIAVTVLQTSKHTQIIIVARDVSERQRVEEALRESEGRYRTLFENANDGIVTFTLEGTVTSVNRGLEAMLRWPRNELIGQHYRKFVSPAGVSLGEERIRRFLLGERVPSIFEAEMVRKDGSVMQVEARTRPIRDKDGTPIGIQGIYRDITERKRAEEALRESEERYRSVITALGEGIVLHYADGTIQACNASAERILGVSAESIKGQTSFDRQKYTIREDGSPFPAEEHPAMATLRTGKPCSNVVMGVYKPNGELGWISINSQPLFYDGTTTPYAVVASFADITARKQAEEGLRQSEERYRNLFENANDAIVVVDLNRTVVSINRAMEQLLGWSREELIGQNTYKVLTPAGIALSEERERRIQNGERVPSIFEHEFVRKDGGKVLVEGRTRFIKDKMGKPIGFQGIYRDITERKQAEEEKQKLQEQLFQARKLEALGTLAGGVAHDFNNILSVVMGFTALVTDDVPEGTVGRRNLEEILKVCRRAKTLVQQILAFSRPQQRTSKPIQIQPVIEEVLTFLRASLPKTIELRCYIDKTAGPVVISSSQLQQVLTNLCANATQALKERSGVLEVSLQQIEVENVLARTQKNLKPGPHLRLTVSDTGCGMTSAVQERIFEPFFTTRPVGEGNGLGLAIVHGIVTGHGGGITVESTPGKGTTFHVYLPVSENDVASENALPHSPPSAGVDSGDEKGAPSDTTHFGY